MALTDEVPNIKIAFKDYKPAQESDLAGWLEKQAEDPNPATSLKTDEDKSSVGTNQVYEDPGERVGDGHDARWGETPKEEPAHHNDNTFKESVNVRRGVLERQLSGFANAQSADQQLLADNFSNVSSGNFEAHSALLQSKTKTGSAEPSLAERVRKLTGRY
jgi:hypothetical protein